MLSLNKRIISLIFALSALATLVPANAYANSSPDVVCEESSYVEPVLISDYSENKIVYTEID